MRPAKVHIAATSVPVNGGGASQHYEGVYDADVCCGEVSRNICVNLHIDPDQTCGVITNVQFYHLPLKMHVPNSLAPEFNNATTTAASGAALQAADDLLLQRWKPLPDALLGTAAPNGHLRLLVKELV